LDLIFYITLLTVGREGGRMAGKKDKAKGKKK
jgi:hypothetical protein